MSRKLLHIWNARGNDELRCGTFEVCPCVVHTAIVVRWFDFQHLDTVYCISERGSVIQFAANFRDSSPMTVGLGADFRVTKNDDPTLL